MPPATFQVRIAVAVYPANTGSTAKGSKGCEAQKRGVNFSTHWSPSPCDHRLRDEWVRRGIEDNALNLRKHSGHTAGYHPEQD